MKQLLVTLLILGSLVFTTTGCNKIKSAVNASLRLSAQVDQLAVSVEKAYDRGAIDRETALAAAKAIRDRVLPAVAAYTTFVDTLQKAYPNGKNANGEKIPADKWAVAQALFSAVESGVREVLVTFKAISAEASAIIGIAIAGLIELINTIRAGFSFAQNHMEVRQWQTNLAE